MLQTLNARTQNRKDFIALFAAVADCFPPPVFHDRHAVPMILIKGDASCGKSLVAETMMRTWSDDHDLQEVLGEEKQHMFLERTPAEAAERTVSKIFNVYGKKVSMHFNSDGIGYSPEVKAREEIKASPTAEGGAVFVSDIGIFDDEYSQGQWLSVGVELTPQNLKLPINLWDRTLSITARHTRLVDDPHFQAKWQKLLRRELG